MHLFLDFVIVILFASSSLCRLLPCQFIKRILYILKYRGELKIFFVEPHPLNKD
jgi:hypothetical protein